MSFSDTMGMNGTIGEDHVAGGGGSISSTSSQIPIFARSNTFGRKASSRFERMPDTVMEGEHGQEDDSNSTSQTPLITSPTSGDPFKSCLILHIYRMILISVH